MHDRPRRPGPRASERGLAVDLEVRVERLGRVADGNSRDLIPFESRGRTAAEPDRVRTDTERVGEGRGRGRGCRAVDRRRGNTDSQRITVAPLHLGAPGARLNMNVDEHTVRARNEDGLSGSNAQ